ncbi:MAG: DUF3298 and DUF4163 domain-containing protein [Bacteroidales bacterium]|nr:DUF3298 and DUF4163 domain-containing protein [Bacteroidales bacterium]
MKTKRFIVLFCLLGIALTGAFAQENFYSRYIGILNNKPALLNLVQVNSKLRAHLFFTEDNAASHTVLTGMLNDQGDFFLKNEYESDTLIKGRMSSRQLEGFYFTASNDIQRLAFSALDEAGSIALMPYGLSVDKKLFEEREESPSAIFESELIVPQAEALNQLQDSILLQAFLEEGQNSALLMPNQVLQQQADTFFNNYKKLSSYDSLPSHSVQWIKSGEVGVVMNQHGLLCIETSEYVFSGGAHGMLNRLFYVFDINSGKRLKMEDIFLAQSDNILTELLTNEIRSRYEIQHDSSLKSFGLFVEVVEPNTNFWISNSGIGFYYNSYELAPYSYGQSDLFLPYTKLEGLLNTDLREKLLLKE